MRAVIFLLIAIAIFLPFNYVAIRQLLRIHPQRRRLIVAVAAAGNLMWPFFLTLRELDALSRFSRALLGPMWFAWTSFAILYTGLMLLVLLAWLPVLRRMPFADFARWPSRIFLALTIVGSIAGFYQALVPLRVERVTIDLDNLPAEAEGMRIAVLCDLHVGLFTRPSRLQQIFATTRALNPDITVILGDLIDDDPFFIPKFLDGVAVLGYDKPVLATLGNHEIYGDPQRVIRALRRTPVRLLVNETFPMRGVTFAGMGEHAATQMPQHRALAPDLPRTIAGAAFPIVLSHQQRIFYDARQRRVPLTLAGHTHGGQCGVRPLGWSLAGVFVQYHMGLYRWGASQMYVNTGTGYWLVPFRLGMTPEITLVELRRKDEG